MVAENSGFTPGSFCIVGHASGLLYTSKFRSASRGEGPAQNLDQGTLCLIIATTKEWSYVLTKNQALGWIPIWRLEKVQVL